MSTGGLIAQAFLGGTQAVGQGIGDRIREEAKLKRQQALEGTRTTETMKRQAHSESLKRGTNEQRHGMTLEQQRQQDEQARGRIKLTDELGQENYSDVTDENGNIIGQRETGSNQYSPFTTKGGSDLSDRQKLAIESLNSEIESIYKGAEAMGGALTPEAQSRIDRLTLQRNQMLYGGGGGSGTILSQLMAGEGGSEAQPESGGTTGDQQAKPSTIGGLLGQAMNGSKKESKTDNVKVQIEALESEADSLLAKFEPRFQSGRTGMTAGNYRPEISESDMAAAQALVQKLIALDENPETSSALSERQRAKMVQRIMDLQKAGVPIELNQ